MHHAVDIPRPSLDAVNVPRCVRTRAFFQQGVGIMSTLHRAACALGLFLSIGFAAPARADEAPRKLQLIDVFQLEYAADPQISPDGKRVVYARTFMDIMKDRRRTNLWVIGTDGKDHRPLTTGNRNDSLPRWAPDGNRLVYVSSESGPAE